MNDDNWYVTTDGETTVGPVTAEQIRRGLAAAKIPPNAKVCRVGGEWTDLHLVPELQSEPSAAPAGTDASARSAEKGAGGSAPAAPARARAGGIPTVALMVAAAVTVLVAGSAVLGGLLLLRPSAPPSGTSTAAAPAVLPSAPNQLPGPFGEVRIGVSSVAVSQAFPPAEPWESCVPALLGFESPAPTLDDAATKRPRSSCPRAADIGGLTGAEILATLQVGDSRERRAEGIRKGTALRTAMGQVRAALRVGAISRVDLGMIQRGGLTDHLPNERVLRVASELVDGSLTFVRPKSARRSICATVKEDCHGLDSEQVGRYLEGRFSLGELDAAARTRVANGKCIGTYVSKERDFQLQFVELTGGLAGIGLARSTQADRTLDPERPNTFAVYKARSGIDGDLARFGVRVANGLEVAKTYFAGALVLEPGEGPWGTAIVWLEGAVVSRVLVNVDGPKEKVREALTTLYGKPPEQIDLQDVWKLDGGLVARLDADVSMSLILEKSGVRAASPSAPAGSRALPAAAPSSP